MTDIAKPRVALAAIAVSLLIASMCPWSAEGDEGTTAPESQPLEDLGPTEVIIRGAPLETPAESYTGSYSVLTPKTLQQNQVQSLQDVTALVPDLNFAGGTARPRFFQIRGIGELEQYEGAPNPSVGLIIDGVDFSGLGVPVTTFDIDQIEVLRGPQGTKFGSSALAGTILMESAAPSSTTSSSTMLSVGSDRLTYGGVAAGGSVSGTQDKVTMRASLSRLTQDGFRHNEFLDRDDTNQREELTARLKADVDFTRDTSLEATGFFFNNNNGYDVFTIRNGFTTQSDNPGRDGLEGVGSSLRFASKLTDELTLSLTTALLNANQDYSFDGDWGNDPFWSPNDPYDYFSDSDRHRRTVSQEFRLSSGDRAALDQGATRWSSGVFVQRLDENTRTSEFASGEIYDSLDSDYRATTGAAFGHVEIPVAERLRFAVGTRIEHRDTRYLDSRAVEFDPAYTMVGGSASLTYAIDDGKEAYLLVSRGFKGGGINPGPSVPVDRRRYDPEYLLNVEGGVQGSWFGNTLRGQLSAFAGRRSDGQLKLAIQDNPSDPLSFTYVTESAATGRNAGTELSVRALVHERVTVFGGGALLYSEYTDVPPELSGLDSRAFPHAPTWSYNAGVRYVPIDHWFAQTVMVGQDRFYFDDSHNERSTPTHRLNVAAGYERGRWQVSVWAKNVLDDRYQVRGFFFGNEPPDFPNKKYSQLGDPFSFGTTLAYRF